MNEIGFPGHMNFIGLRPTIRRFSDKSDGRWVVRRNVRQGEGNAKFQSPHFRPLNADVGRFGPRPVNTRCRVQVNAGRFRNPKNVTVHAANWSSVIGPISKQKKGNKNRWIETNWPIG